MLPRGLLSDDQSACSFTNEDIFDLTNVQVPETTAGKQLGQMVATATLWTHLGRTAGAEDVQTLMNEPGNAAALHSLRPRNPRWRRIVPLHEDTRRQRTGARHPPSRGRPSRGCQELLQLTALSQGLEVLPS